MTPLACIGTLRFRGQRLKASVLISDRAGGYQALPVDLSVAGIKRQLESGLAVGKYANEH